MESWEFPVELDEFLEFCVEDRGMPLCFCFGVGVPFKESDVIRVYKSHKSRHTGDCVELKSC